MSFAVTAIATTERSTIARRLSTKIVVIVFIYVKEEEDGWNYNNRKKHPDANSQIAAEAHNIPYHAALPLLPRRRGYAEDYAIYHYYMLLFFSSLDERNEGIE